jgi:hypothetical protein
VPPLDDPLPEGPPLEPPDPPLDPVAGSVPEWPVFEVQAHPLPASKVPTTQRMPRSIARPCRRRNFIALVEQWRCGLANENALLKNYTTGLDFVGYCSRAAAPRSLALVRACGRSPRPGPRVDRTYTHIRVRAAARIPAPSKFAQIGALIRVGHAGAGRRVEAPPAPGDRGARRAARIRAAIRCAPRGTTGGRAAARTAARTVIVARAQSQRREGSQQECVGSIHCFSRRIARFP